MDSDRQFVVAELADLWRLKDDADLVLGVRAARRDPRHRLLLSGRRRPRRLAARGTPATRSERPVPPLPPRGVGGASPTDRPEHACTVDPARRRGRGTRPPDCRGPGDASAPRAGRVEPAPLAPRLFQPPWASPARRVPACSDTFACRRTTGGRGAAVRDARAAVARPLRPGLSPSATLGGLRAWVVETGWVLLPFAVVAVTALALRLVSLSDKPLHHDESEHAWFAWRIVTGHGYQYDPTFHGPVQFSLTTLVYLVLGVGDFAARVAPALLGTAITLLPFFLRRQIGTAAALRRVADPLRQPELPLLLPLRPRGHLRRLRDPRAACRRLPLPRTGRSRGTRRSCSACSP